MRKIFPLPKKVREQIAAGEVIESPLNVLKELIENALDAKAEEIEIYLENKGLSLIQVKDNGVGISKEDLLKAIEPFSTSKISSLEDLYHLESFGFRGEALHSIKSVSYLKITSKTKEEKIAYTLEVEEGKDPLITPTPFPYPQGCIVEVKELFYNLPARRKYLEKQLHLLSKIEELIKSYLLLFPNVYFSYSIEKKEKISFPPSSLSKRIEKLFQIPSKKLLPVFQEKENLSLEGYLAPYPRKKSPSLFFFVNKRPILYPPLHKILYQIGKNHLPSNQQTLGILFLSLSPQEVDINVHPQKKEVRFYHEEKVLEFLEESIKKALLPTPKKIKHIYIKPSFSSSTKSFNSLKESPSLSFSPSSSNQSKKTPTFSFFLFPQKVLYRLFESIFIGVSEDALFLIDQHTVHERIRYEKFLKKLLEKKGISQRLLLPIKLSLYPSQRALYKEKKELLEEIGFFLEEDSLIGIPSYFSAEEAKIAFLKALEGVSPQKSLEENFHYIASNIACKGAIKRGDIVSLSQMDALLEELKNTKEPHICPHGRATFFPISKKEIFQLLERPFLKEDAYPLSGRIFG